MQGEEKKTEQEKKAGLLHAPCIQAFTPDPVERAGGNGLKKITYLFIVSRVMYIVVPRH